MNEQHPILLFIKLKDRYKLEDEDDVVGKMNDINQT
jgi:hypothetical protein